MNALTNLSALKIFNKIRLNVKKWGVVGRAAGKGCALCFVLLRLLVLEADAQQSFSYTQFMNNLTPINSANAVMDNDGTVNTLLRKQWVGIDGAPTTFFFNGNVPIEDLDASAGLIFMSDQFAVENLTEINAFFAKSIQLNATQYLAVSINAGYKNYVANYTQLDPSDYTLGPDIREDKPNVGFGILYFSKEFYVGISVPELTITNLGKASVKDNNYFRNNYFFTGGLSESVSDGIKIKPSVLVSYTRGVPLIADISTMFVVKDIVGLGIDYRTNSETAIILSTDFSVFHIAYSYQFGLSSTNIGYTNATQEITLGYRFGKKGLNINTVDRSRDMGY